MKNRSILFLFVACLLLASLIVIPSCAGSKTSDSSASRDAGQVDTEPADCAKWAGIRVSSYGMEDSFGEGKFPKVKAMSGFAQKMADRYEGSTGTFILIVGVVSESEWTCRLDFPLSHEIDMVQGKDEDFYEAYLKAFDKACYSVWLQVEPGNADLVALATEVMNHYKNHPCVKGFGIDVEWYKPAGTRGYGTKLDEDLAARVLEAVRAVNPDYTVFVKHWDNKWLPDAMDGLIYVNDSQGFRGGRSSSALDKMKEEFSAWAFYFDPCPVMFQIGYEADEGIWGEMENPAKELGAAILDACYTDNDKGIIWVDFTLADVIDKGK